jgi:hypothetical protein
MHGDPDVVVQATSEAVSVQPDDVVDLVGLAKPRFGLVEPHLPFHGIHLDPPVGADTLLASLGFRNPVGSSSDGPGEDSVVLLIQRLQLTPSCQLSIEQMVAGWIRVDIRSVISDSTRRPDLSCWISAEMLVASAPSDTDPSRFSRDTVILPERPASLQFRPRDPLDFRPFAVTGLGFTTNESGSLESAIRGAFVRLPDHGNRSDTVYAGDWLTLGNLEGELADLQVDGDGIKTLFKGKASDVAIGTRRITPSLLRQGFYAEDFRIIVALIIAFASVAMAIFQVTLKP